MAKKITIRDVMNEFNISVETIVDFLKSKDIEVKKATPRAPISEESYALLLQEFQSDKSVNDESTRLHEKKNKIELKLLFNSKKKKKRKRQNKKHKKK